MSAKRIIAVAEAMMRQSRRAGGVFAFLALLGSGWVVRLEVTARPAEPWQVGLPIGSFTMQQPCPLSAPSLERFRERVVRIKQQIGVERS